MSTTIVGSVAAEEHDSLLRVRDVSSILKLSIRQVWRLSSSGQIPKPIKVGNSTRWRLRDIRRFIEGAGS